MAARIQSVDALADLKAAIWKFVEAASVALGESDAEIDRTIQWLQTEQAQHWKGQVRKRTDAVAQAKAAIRAKKLFRPDGFRPSAVEEEQALAAALRRLDEANQRVENVKRYTQRLQKQALMYRGQVQRMSRFLQTELPQAAASLEQLIRSVEAYLAHAPEEAGRLRPGEEPATDYQVAPDAASMARAEPGRTEGEQEGGAADSGQGGQRPKPGDDQTPSDNPGDTAAGPPA